VSFPPQEGHANRILLPLASFLNDLGWELPILLLPLFVLNVLGAGPLAVGLISGVADATQSLTKIASGVLSDRLGRRKLMTASGYGIATAARSFLYVIGSWPLVLVSRFFDQIGKGLRSSARDALLADSTTEGEMGRSFGLLRGMDSLGAAGSMLIGIVVIYLVQGTSVQLKAQTFRVLVLIGIVFGVAAFAVAAFLARDVAPRRRSGLDLEARAGIPTVFLLFTGVNVLFSLGNSSDAFLILRTQNLGGSLIVIATLIGGFNLIYASFARSLGIFSDRFGKRRLMVMGWALYALSYLGFARSESLIALGIVLIPYGLYYGLTEGIGRALIADIVPSGSRGAAYGIFYGILGFSGLASSVIAGVLYQLAPPAPFYFGAALAAVACVALILIPLPRSVSPA
jgi:MFS family permease